MRSEPPEEDEGPEAGFVLLSVLMVVILFVGLAASLAVKSRLLAMQAANRVVAAQAQAIADGAALLAAEALRPAPRAAPNSEALVAAALSGNAETVEPAPHVLPLPVDGTPLACALEDGSAVVVRAVDQGGLLDLNGAPVPMLRAFFSAAGLDGQTALRLAEDIADFRDPDDAPEGTGVGERAQYAAAGLAWGPRNAPFADAGEIAQLPSVSPTVADRLRPLLTVENPRAGIDLSATDIAARGVLSAEALKASDVARWNLPSGRDRFSVEARLVSRSGAVTAARGLVATFDGEATGALVLRRWWRPPIDARAGAPRPGDVPFCARLSAALDGSDS